MTTVLCGSISLHPASLGSTMHRAAYRALGLDYNYVPFKVTDVAGALTGMRALGIRGFGVSMPHKLTVIPLLDRLAPLAKRIGAVNTIVNDDGVLTGHNTDALGARGALEEHTELAGKRVVLVGAGGAARAVAFSLLEAGAHVTLVNRSPERAQELAATLTKELGDDSAVGCGSLDAPPADVDILVNTSSGGMANIELDPRVNAFVEAPAIVMDIVYKPTQTALVALARARGKVAIHGGRMLLHQAQAQFELYTGRRPALEIMDRALREALGEA
ncbi:MAG: shikimate dehydrogenase [Polyangiaceae bacterium]